MQNQQSYITNHVLLLTGTKMGFMSDRISKEQVREVLNIEWKTQMAFREWS